MTGRRQSRGISLPSLGQVLLTGVVISAGWVLQDCYQQRSVNATGKERLLGNSVERIQAIEALVDRGPDSTPVFVDLLSSTEPKFRSLALYGLGRLKQCDSLPLVRQRLADDDPGVRRTALTTFNQICEDRVDLIAVAAGMVGDPCPENVELASYVLDSYGSDVIPWIIELVHSSNSAVRVTAVGLLTNIDRDRHDPSEVNGVLRGMLDDADLQVRQGAIEAMVVRGAATVDEVGAWLRDENPNVVRAGYRAVFSLRDDAVRVLPQIQDRIANLDGKFPYQITVLNVLKTDARPVVPILLQVVPSLSSTAKIDAIETLHAIGAEAADLEHLLICLLSDPDSNVRIAAGRLLVQISPEHARRQMAEIVGGLELREKLLRNSDLDVLLGLGAQARAAVPLLIRLLRHPDEDVVTQTLLILCEIGEPAAAAVPVLNSMLCDTSTSKRQFGLLVQILGAIGPAARPVVPKLLEVLEGPTRSDSMPFHPSTWPDQHIIACWALGRVGDDSTAVLASLRHQLELGTKLDPMMPEAAATLRRVVLESLAKLTCRSDILLDDAIELLNDRAGPVRMQAALAIGSLAGDRRLAVEPLAAALFDRDCYVRTAAALTLQAISPVAKQAIPALAEAVRDTRNWVPNSFAEQPRTECSGLVLCENDLKEISVAIAARRALEAITTQLPDKSR